jgi:SAM-dependent methyltransferase
VYGPAVARNHMQRFWDARAREDAFYFVDNTLPYRTPDIERFWAGGTWVLDQFAERLGIAIAPGDVVIDLGCGLGRLTRVVAARAARVLAIDISPEMLARARELNPQLTNVDWLAGDGFSLQPVGDGAADALISHVVFHHIPDPQITLGYVTEMGRVLRPGGWAAFQIANVRPEHVLPPARRRPLAKLRRRLPRGDRDPAWRGSSVDLDELRDVANDAGLDVEQIDGEGQQFCLVLVRRR